MAICGQGIDNTPTHKGVKREQIHDVNSHGETFDFNVLPAQAFFS